MPDVDAVLRRPARYFYEEIASAEEQDELDALIGNICADPRVDDEIKFVLSSRADYDFAREFTQRHNLARRVNAVLLSPAFRKDATGARDSSHCLIDPQELAEWMIADSVPARLGLQLHKFIWDPALKGV